MKHHILFLVVALVVNSVQARSNKDAKEFYRHSSNEAKSKDYYTNHELSKSRQEKAVSDNSTNVAPPNVSNVNEYTLANNESVYLNYNESSYFYGIWNPTKQLALLYASRDDLLGVYNATSTSLLVIATQNNQVSIRINITIEFTTSDLPRAFSRLYDIIVAGRVNHNNSATLTVDVFFGGLLNANVQNQCQQNVDFFGYFRTTFGRYFQELRRAVSNGIRGFGSFFIPLLSRARNAAVAFARFFGAAIQNSSRLPRNLIQAFTIAIGRGAEFLNTNFVGQLTYVLRGVGSFFGNITEGLTQVFLGGGIRNFTTGVISDGDGSNIGIGSLITGDNSWLVRIGNSSVNMTISYNSNHNLFGFYNRDLNISVVFDGTNGFYVLFNTTSGVGLTISQTTGNARVVIDRSGQIHNAFQEQRNFTNGFILIGRVIEHGSGGLNNIINLDSSVFNFKLVVFLIRSGFNIDIAFLGKDQAFQTIRTNFGRLFDEAHVYFQRSDSGFDLSLGPLNILFPVLHFSAFTNNFIPIIRNIFTNLNGLFNPSLIIQMASTFGTNLSSGLNRFFFGPLSYALNSARNFSGGINNIIRGILGSLPSAQIDIDFQFGQRPCNCGN